MTWLSVLSPSEVVAFFFTAWLWRKSECQCEEYAALQSTVACTRKMWAGDEWMALGWGRTSQPLHLVSAHSCSVRAPSFSSFQRACATIVNHDKAFLECHSHTYWCACWTQLQMRQVEWCQWPKAMRCWEKTRAVKVFFSFWNAKYSCLGAYPPYARYSIMFLADRCSCRFFLDELFVFAARGEGFDVELVFYILP